MAEPVSTVVDIVTTTLDTCPAELAGDIMARGIALTGGGAMLRGLDDRLREETGMPDADPPGRRSTGVCRGRHGAAVLVSGADRSSGA